VAEWSNALDLKSSDSQESVGSNPTLSVEGFLFGAFSNRREDIVMSDRSSVIGKGDRMVISVRDDAYRLFVVRESPKVG
jgi:hypothetical protein